MSSVLDRGIKKSGDYSEEYMDSLKNDLDNVDAVSYTHLCHFCNSHYTFTVDELKEMYDCCTR